MHSFINTPQLKESKKEIKQMCSRKRTVTVDLGLQVQGIANLLY